MLSEVISVIIILLIIGMVISLTSIAINQLLLMYRIVKEASELQVYVWTVPTSIGTRLYIKNLGPISAIVTQVFTKNRLINVNVVVRQHSMTMKNLNYVSDIILIEVCTRDYLVCKYVKPSVSFDVELNKTRSCIIC